jgi:predicted TIM-barrel fold metal-dependent hydrolase
MAAHVSKNLTETLANASQQAKARNYADLLIIDTDCHHMETSNRSWKGVSEYIEDDTIRLRVENALRMRPNAGAPGSMIPDNLGDRHLGGRIQRLGLSAGDIAPGEVAEAAAVKRAEECMGIDYSILFPTQLINIGVLPEIDVQVHIMWAYARWLTENLLPTEPSIKTMVCLPFNDADASLRMVKTFGDRPGVLGFVIGGTFHHPVHAKRYMPIYAEIEALGKPIAFHSAYNWRDRLTEQFNKFLSAHGVGRTLYNMVHITNWTINGIPERFPKLRAIWIESGVTFVPFLMQRLDAEYMMRSSEAPLLAKLPSEYMRDYFYTTQPLEKTVHQDALAMTFDMIGADSQLLYASDYPHWDFDLPSVIYDLPFLSDKTRRNILGETALKLFGLERPSTYNDGTPSVESEPQDPARRLEVED